MATNYLEKMDNVEKEIKELQKRKQQLRQKYNEQERKERNHRLCKRGGMWESLLPDTIKLSDEQFETFLFKTTANDYGRRILAEMVANNAETLAVPNKNTPVANASVVAPEPIETAVQTNTMLLSTPVKVSQDKDVADNADGGGASENG